MLFRTALSRAASAPLTSSRFASTYAKAQITGFVGGDLDVKTSPKGNEYASYSVAVNNDPRGSEEASTSWYKVFVFGDRNIDSVKQNIEKGKYVLVEGRLQLNPTGGSASIIQSMYTPLSKKVFGEGSGAEKAFAG